MNNESIQSPEGSLEAAFQKFGGKKVCGATPQTSAEPDPKAVAEVGEKYVGKIPAAIPPAKE